MPTPNDDVLHAHPAALNVHATCPDNDRVEAHRTHEPTNIDLQHPQNERTHTHGSFLHVTSPRPESYCENEGGGQRRKANGMDGASSAPERDSPAPSLNESDPKDAEGLLSPLSVYSHLNSAPAESTLMGSGFQNTRVRPNYSSSFLRAGSKFTGSQQSDKQIYKVEVNIKHVDMKESFVCGYLRIEGLTKDHPTLTTYFEGEIIGPKYTFQTKHESWGATEKTDMQHWDRFLAWRPLARLARKPDFHYKDCAQKENIFMRWKEYFLVPDHRVREIQGASFEGFYYICFNQVSGTISGIYFHAKSEKFQQLELKHVDDMGCLGAVEFR